MYTGGGFSSTLSTAYGLLPAYPYITSKHIQTYTIYIIQTYTMYIIHTPKHKQTYTNNASSISIHHTEAHANIQTYTLYIIQIPNESNSTTHTNTTQ